MTYDTLRRWSVRLLGVCTVGLLATGCLKAPVQIGELHAMGGQSLQSLQASHIAMIDAFVDERVQRFDTFFFEQYGPAYFVHWKKRFPEVHGRPYDEARDFSVLYSDLVAEYEELTLPFDTLRVVLKAAVAAEYSNALAAHTAVHDWISSAQKLNDSQKAMANRVLAFARRDLTIETIDATVTREVEALKSKLAGLTK